MSDVELLEEEELDFVAPVIQKPKVTPIEIRGKKYLDVTDSYTSAFTYAAQNINVRELSSQDELSL